ncbi:MAG: hypothetical protein ACJ74Y_16480 [Bryobacteraceae bacterium]
MDVLGKRSAPTCLASNPTVPSTLDPITAKEIDQAITDRFGVAYTISASPIVENTVPVGTDDGKSWNDVTPKELTAWSKVSQVEAGHFEVETAYASVDRHRIADDKTHIFRTHEGGRTWRNVVAGIPQGTYVNSVKDDTQTDCAARR